MKGPNKMDLSFGSIVSVNAKLERKTLRTPKYRIFREWITAKTREKNCIVIGRRTLHNGYIINEFEIGNVFYQTDSMSVYLVVESMNRKPFYVLEKNVNLI